MRRGGVIVFRPVRRQRERGVLIDALAAALPGSVAEHTLIPGRRYRADLAWPAAKVAVELQGGSWVAGHHVRPVEYERDCWKVLQAARSGWLVLPLTWQMLGERFDDIAAALAVILEERRRGP